MTQEVSFLPPLDCFLVADDLTGACDSAVHFAVRGRHVVVPVAAGAQGVEGSVVAINTNSRSLEPAAARNAIVAAAGLPAGSPRFLFKKIDSTLRGHPGIEISAMLTSFGCNAALVCPAFPNMSRVVEGGLLLVPDAPDFHPIQVAAYLRSQNVTGCIHTRREAIPNAIAAGARVVVADAVCDADLDQIAAIGLALDIRVLWAGSGGLAAALARTLAIKPRPLAETLSRGPVLFCLGSDHPATTAQQAALVAERQALVAHAGLTDTREIAGALISDRPVVLRLFPGRASAAWVQQLAASVRLAALALCGGDTAEEICRTAGVHWIEILDEIIPGVPRGVMRGGVFDGVPTVTKSGAFGGGDALIQIADYFTCQTEKTCPPLP